MRKHHDDLPAFDITSKRRKSFPSEPASSAAGVSSRRRRAERKARPQRSVSVRLRTPVSKACCMASGGHDGSNRHGYFQGLGGWPDCSGHPRLLQGWKASCRSPAFAQRKPGSLRRPDRPRIFAALQCGLRFRKSRRPLAGQGIRPMKAAGDGDRDGQRVQIRNGRGEVPKCGGTGTYSDMRSCASAIRRNPWRRRARSAAASPDQDAPRRVGLRGFCPFRDTMTDNSVARSNRSSPRPDQ